MLSQNAEFCTYLSTTLYVPFLIYLVPVQDAKILLNLKKTEAVISATHFNNKIYAFCPGRVLCAP
jgi:hypothetical protein